jgi:hypothetical protein
VIWKSRIVVPLPPRVKDICLSVSMDTQSFPSGENQSGLEADNSPLSNGEVKSKRRLRPPPSHMHGVHSDNITLLRDNRAE